MSIATDQTNTCSLGENFCIVLVNFFQVFILAKEIRLKHKAPVLSIIVLDSLNQSIGQGSGIPIKESTMLTTESPITTTTNSENVTSHKVLICSEEQFKVKRIHFYSLDL